MPGRRRSSGCSTAGPTRSGPRARSSARSAPSSARREYEITTHRAEAYSPDSRKPEVSFTDAIDADLSRRDFTVNAMALELTSDAPVLVDPVRRRGRPAGQAAAHPVVAGGVVHRRSAADAARPRASSPATNWSRTPSWSRPCATSTNGCEIVSAERISDGVRQADHARPPGRRGCGSWSTPGLADEFLPELPAMRLEQDPIHRHKDVLAHTIAVVENVQRDAQAETSTSASRGSPRCSTTSASRRPAAIARAPA